MQDANKIVNVQVGLFRLEIVDFSEKVFQEALFNALSHRDYQKTAVLSEVSARSQGKTYRFGMERWQPFPSNGGTACERDGVDVELHLAIRVILSVGIW